MSLNKDLIDRLEAYIKKKEASQKELRDISSELFPEAKAKLLEMGWDEGFLYGISHVIKHLRAPPEANWKEFLYINYEPVEIRKIDGVTISK